MPKDKRVKGCPNIKCERNSEHYKYKAEDSFCTKCGSELVFMCPKCYGKLADLGPEHVVCDKCAAIKDDRKNSGKKRREARRETIKGGAKATANGIYNGAKATVKGLGNAVDRIENTAKNGVEQIKEIIEDVHIKELMKRPGVISETSEEEDNV